MKKIDGRKLSPKARGTLRIRAVQLVETGKSPEKFVEILGFLPSAISQWIAKYREGWQGGIENTPHNRSPTKA